MHVIWCVERSQGSSQIMLLSNIRHLLLLTLPDNNSCCPPRLLSYYTCSYYYYNYNNCYYTMYMYIFWSTFGELHRHFGGSISNNNNKHTNIRKWQIMLISAHNNVWSSSILGHRFCVLPIFASNERARQSKPISFNIITPTANNCSMADTWCVPGPARLPAYIISAPQSRLSFDLDPRSNLILNHQDQSGQGIS